MNTTGPNRDTHASASDLINASHRPGALSWLFNTALRRWEEHAAGDDGTCTCPGCTGLYPCPPAIEIERLLDACPTYWARLDRPGPSTLWPDNIPGTDLGHANGPARPAYRSGLAGTAGGGQAAPACGERRRVGMTRPVTLPRLHMAGVVTAALVVSALGATVGMFVALLAIMAVPSITVSLQQFLVILGTLVGALVAARLAPPIADLRRQLASAQQPAPPAAPARPAGAPPGWAIGVDHQPRRGGVS